MLEREIPGSGGLRDAMGCYPLFSCPDWAGLPEDLEALRADGIVSLVLVADPLTSPPADLLAWTFDGVCRPFKTHYLADLTPDTDVPGSAHHRRYARRYLRTGTVDIAADPRSHLEDWNRLYGKLTARHGIEGVARFSPRAFAHQLVLPGTVAVLARDATGAVEGMQIWYADGNRAWYHLGAQTPAAYDRAAGFAMTRKALEHLSGLGVRTADLGSGAGLADDPDDGLSRFKAGWATRTTQAWLCGAILDQGAYTGLSPAASAYFPAYRDPAVRSNTGEGHVHAR